MDDFPVARVERFWGENVLNWALPWDLRVCARARGTGNANNGPAKKQ